MFLLFTSQTQLETALRDAITKCDILCCTGGVSMGALDLVQPLLEKICGGLHFGRLLMKPGTHCVGRS